MNKNFLLITLILLVSPSVETKENTNYFDAMDVFDLEWASDPQVSSDGETIVYVRKSNDIMKDRVRSLSLIHISEPRDISGSRMPSSA